MKEIPCFLVEKAQLGFLEQRRSCVGRADALIASDLDVKGDGAGGDDLARQAGVDAGAVLEVRAAFVAEALRGDAVDPEEGFGFRVKEEIDRVLAPCPGDGAVDAKPEGAPLRAERHRADGGRVGEPLGFLVRNAGGWAGDFDIERDALGVDAL